MRPSRPQSLSRGILAEHLVVGCFSLHPRSALSWACSVPDLHELARIGVGTAATGSVVRLALTLWLLPETKGKSLEELSALPRMQEPLRAPIGGIQR